MLLVENGFVAGNRKTGIVPPTAPLTMTGLEILHAMMRGDIPAPPITALMDFVLTRAEAGLVLFEGTPRAEQLNPYGTIHGGYTATLLDSAMTCAVQSMLPVGMGVTTLEFKVSFVRGYTPATARVRAEGRAINVGRRVGLAEGRLIDDSGRVLAHGTTTCLVFDIRDMAGTPPKP